MKHHFELFFLILVKEPVALPCPPLFPLFLANPALLFGFQLLNSALLIAWKLVNERLPSGWSFWSKLATLIGSVLSLWFCGAAFIVLVLEGSLDIRPLYLGISCLILHFLLGVLVLLLSPSNAPKGANKPSPWVYLIRGGAATTTIFVGSIVARSQPSLGGFVSCFPVIYLTTMIGVWVSQGDKVAAGAAGPMVLGGLAVSIFAFCYGVLFAHFGWLSSAIMGYLIAVICWSIPLAFFLRWYSARLALTTPAPPPQSMEADPIQKLYELDASVFGKQSTDLEEGRSGSQSSLSDNTDSTDVVKLDL